MAKAGKALLTVLVLMSPGFSMAGGGAIYPPKPKPDVSITITTG